MDLYTKTCLECSEKITRRYSTSFSLGIRCFEKKFRAPICAIYGFVRFADEIVDTFHDQDKADLLEKYKSETYLAIQKKISLNPVLHAFQQVVNEYNIEIELIEAFLKSMEMDLYNNTYARDGYNEYIYGSAEVVGLMCLRVFCENNDELYQSLVEPARSLGSAFQKVNFLRDLKSDFNERGRVYFPGVDFKKFDIDSKNKIEEDIKLDFEKAYEGILRLPSGTRFGVYMAYKYYTKLFDKIRKSSVEHVKSDRIRVNDSHKIILLLSSAVKSKLNLL
jgi:phytoene synthase